MFETVVCSLASRGLQATCTKSRQFIQLLQETRVRWDAASSVSAIRSRSLRSSASFDFRTGLTSAEVNQKLRIAMALRPQECPPKPFTCCLTRRSRTKTRSATAASLGLQALVNVAFPSGTPREFGSIDTHIWRRNCSVCPTARVPRVPDRPLQN